MYRLSVLLAPCSSWLSFSSLFWWNATASNAVPFKPCFTSPLIGLWLLLMDRQVHSYGFSFEAIFSFLFDSLLIRWDSLLAHPMKRALIALFSAAGGWMAKCTQRSHPFFVRTAARGSPGSAYHSWQRAAPRFRPQRRNPGSPRGRKFSSLRRAREPLLEMWKAPWKTRLASRSGGHSFTFGSWLQRPEKCQLLSSMGKHSGLSRRAVSGVVLTSESHQGQ